MVGLTDPSTRQGGRPTDNTETLSYKLTYGRVYKLGARSHDGPTDRQ